MRKDVEQLELLLLCKRKGMNKLQLHTMKWMNLLNKIERKKSQTQKHTHTIQFHLYKVQKIGKTTVRC